MFSTCVAEYKREGQLVEMIYFKNGTLFISFNYLRVNLMHWHLKNMNLIIICVTHMTFIPSRNAQDRSWLNSSDVGCVLYMWQVCW